MSVSYTHLLLDPHGDAPVPTGYLLVATELDWLRETTNAGLAVPPVVVRGAALTRWASTWWKAQGGKCHELVSPGRMLQLLVPELPTAAAQAVAQELLTYWGEGVWPSDLTLSEVLTVLYPSARAVWEAVPNSEAQAVAAVAGQWLEWLQQSGRTEWPTDHESLLKTWLKEWQKVAPQIATILPLDPVAALEIFRAWVGLSASPVARSVRHVLNWAGVCPVPVPAPWQAVALRHWETDLPLYVAARSKGTDADTAVATWWAQVNSQHLHPDLTPLALGVVVQYIHQHPAVLTAKLLHTLRTYMNTEDYHELAQYLPPPQPSPMPTEPAAVLQWVTEEYLPFRQWQAGLEYPDEDAIALVRHHAISFGNWLMTTYPGRLSGATHPYQQLYWAQAGQILPKQQNEVVIWVIADGLGWTDARYLAQKIGELSANRIATTEAARCFGLLPTITRFTKVPVRAGIPYQTTLARLPELMAEAAADVRDRQDPVPRARQLTGGQLLVWKPLEPDSTYHDLAEASSVRRNVLGVLATMAKTIVDIAKEISRTLDLRILITTDHGRMAGPGVRGVSVPEGFEAHGRAAYRTMHGPPPAQSDDIVWLDPDFFNLPDWVGVIKDERSFRVQRKDGGQASGPDNFSHGGIWPEEVVVPWLTLLRDAVPINVTGTASGRARVGSVGTIMLHLFNEAERPVILRRVQFTVHGSSTLEIEVTATLPGQQFLDVAVPLSQWPEGLHISAADLVAVVELPDGREQQFSLTNQLSSDEFQTRQVDLLGDL